jgi:hypothetical protein
LYYSASFDIKKSACPTDYKKIRCYSTLKNMGRLSLGQASDGAVLRHPVGNPKRKVRGAQ